MATNNSAAKKAVADDIFKALNPHFSALLGSNQALGFQTSGSNTTERFTAALKLWLEQDNADELVGFLRTAQVTGVLSESELDTFLDKIEAIK